MKKIIFCFVILTIILVIIGCQKDSELLNESGTAEQQINLTPLPEELIKIRVTPQEGISQEELEELKKLGLYESNEGKTLIGNVNKDVFQNLNKSSSVKKIEERIEIEYPPQVLERGQIGAKDEQQAIDELRSKLNLTGPYVEQLVYDELEKKGTAYVGIRFRLGESNEVYESYIANINSSLTEEEFHSIEYLGSGTGRLAFRAIINKDGLNKLKDNPIILEISLVRQ